MTNKNRGESEISTATRRSIRQNFPLGNVMATGRNNPITLHSVDDRLFASMWSFIAETMVVTGELQRDTKEAIATLVSERNSCPVCVKAHSMMGIMATKVVHCRDESLHYEALKYAELLIYEVNAQRSMCVDHAGNFDIRASPGMVDTNCWKHLKEAAKTEVALVCALFMHMNRVVSAIMGEEMTTAMMSVPRMAAKVMESKSAIKVMGHIMSPLMAKTFKATPERGFTECLFPPDDDNKDDNHPGKKLKLPPGLQNLMLAGHERAKAVARLLQWASEYESDLLLEGDLFDYDIIHLIDRITKTSQEDIQVIDPVSDSVVDEEEVRTPAQVLEWVEMKVRFDMEREAEGRPVEDWTMALATVLILITMAPKAIYKSKPWKTLVAHVGDVQARSIVVFWSLRTTLQEAEILFNSLGEQSAPEL